MPDTQQPHFISVIIPVYNASATLERCLSAVTASEYKHYECIVVDDGSNDGSQAIARQYSERVIEYENGPFGPAYARNRGAEIATGDILFFIDSDVIIYPDTLSKVAQTFNEHPDYIATFGSYDDSPGDGEFLSQYKNLFHHFVHQQGNVEGGTFWSGCGAVYRRVFLEMRGFDMARYPRPSIEDIELGCRMRAAGYKIYLNKDIQVKHMKRWTLMGLLKSDVLDRAIPWTQLILQERNLPNDLNLSSSQRASALLLGILLLFLAGTALFYNIILLPLTVILFMLVVSGWQFYRGRRLFRMDWLAEALAYLLSAAIGVLAWREGLPGVSAAAAFVIAALGLGRWLPDPSQRTREALFAATSLALVCGVALILASYPVWITAPVLLLLLVIILLNERFYRFFTSKRGIVFTLAVFPFHMLYYLYSMVAFAVGGGMHIWKTSLKPR